LALDDEYTIESSLDSIALDVLANDSARTTSGKLELIGVQTTGNPQGLVSIDPATNRLIYTPNPGFMGFDEYIYTIANENGLIAQALLKITVAPAMTFVGTTGDQRGTMIEVYDSLSGKLLNEFKPFGDYTGPMVMQSADANGDGKAELFAMQTGGDGRMRVFDSTGKTMVDTVYRPFGNRRISGMDMEVGNMDADNSPEMFFVANTSRGYELRVVDSSTMQTQMTTVMRGMSGTPQLEFDDTADKLMIMGRTRGGGVVMAAMTSNDSGQTNISRKTMVSDRDMRRMTRRNGPVTDVTLASTDQNGDGVMDAEMIQISFRNGLVQQMMLNDDGSVASSASRQATADQPQIIMAALGVAMTPTGDMVWTDTTDPSRRNRSRIVAIG
ncbi:MAG: Ig-like domain-containing protein, partial [bacterium]